MKSYTKNPQSIEETRTNKFISMRAIENRRDKLINKGRSLEFANLLDKVLIALDSQSELESVVNIIDDHDAIQVIEKYS